MISDLGEEQFISKSRHSEAQIIAALKQVEAGRTAEDVARECGVSKHTIYAWKAKYGGMEASEAQRLKQLEDENGRLKRLVADLSLDREMLKAVIAKNGLRISPHTRRSLAAKCSSSQLASVLRSTSVASGQQLSLSVKAIG
jgi:putative transposase